MEGDEEAAIDTDADAEEIEDEETPLTAPENSDTGSDNGETEIIEDEATAQASVGGSWALINLVLMALTVLAGVVMLGLRFRAKTARCT